jgi:hypothetical protein
MKGESPVDVEIRTRRPTCQSLWMLKLKRKKARVLPHKVLILRSNFEGLMMDERLYEMTFSIYLGLLFFLHTIDY